MEGADVVPYISGIAEQGNALAGIETPNHDSVVEFEVRTAPDDAGFWAQPPSKLRGCDEGWLQQFPQRQRLPSLQAIGTTASTVAVSPATGAGSGPNFGPVKTASLIPRVIWFGLKFLV